MSLYLSQIRAFTRDARLFLLAMTVLAFGQSAPVVFGALYFRAIGFDQEWLGWVATANQFGGALGLLPAMLLTERVGRRASIAWGVVGGLLTSAFAVSTASRELALVWLAVSGLFNVWLGLAVVPLLAEVSTPFERTTLFAVRDGLITLTQFAGSMLVGYLPAALAPLLNAAPESASVYRAVLLGSVLVRLIALIPLLMMGRVALGSRASPQVQEEADDASVRTRLTDYLDPRRFKRLRTPIVAIGLPVVLVYFGGTLVFPFLSVFLKDKHGASDPEVAMAWALIYLAIGFGALLAPLLVQLIGRRTLVIVCALVSGVGIAMIALAESHVFAVTAAVLRAGIFNLSLPVYRAIVIDAAPKHEHTITALVLSGAENVGATAAPPISGRAQLALGYEPVFLAAALFYGLGALAFVRALRMLKTPEKPAS